MAIERERRRGWSPRHQFHALGPRLGLPKMASVAVLLGSAVVWVVWNRREILRTRWLTLLAALVALATSVLLDYERARSTSMSSSRTPPS